MVSTLQMTKVAALTLADYAEMPFTPALSLDTKFDASVTDDPEFGKGCYWGYEAYFEQRCEWLESGAVIALRQLPGEVLAQVREMALPGQVPGVEDLSLAWRAGFGVGWLSALALTDRAMAQQALTVLEALLIPQNRQRWGLRDESVHVASRVCPRSVDSAGWPLDM